MAIRPKDGGWQVDVTFRGKRAPRVTVPTHSEAETLAAQFKADLMAGREPAVQSARVKAHKSSVQTLDQLLSYTLRHRWAGTKSEYNSELNARICVDHLGHSTLTATVTGSMISDMADEFATQGNANGTINRKLAALRVMLKIAVEKGDLDALPQFPKRREYEGRLRWFSDEELHSLLGFHHGDDRFCDMVALGVDTGFRLAELTNLKVKDFSLSTGMLTTWETKGNKARSVPLTPRAKAIVMRLRGNKRDYEPLLHDALTSKQLNVRIKSWARWAGLPDDDEACFHTTRHTCCSKMVQGGVFLPVIQKWMGHSDIKTTMRYAHLAPNAFDDALAVLAKGN